ncbi:hypothetical protein DRO42_03415 [Candidatus Bathyarchaeota archaeon]|nr:MAG: hypothetical protein DRO42_03415 [Candidatus Bathyarchaeota archaeon]
MERRYFERRPRIESVGAIAVALIIIIGGVLVFSVGRVSVGYVAVVVDPLLGTTSAVGDGANARYFLKPPWASVFKVYVATDSVHMWSEDKSIGDFPAVPTLTKDGLKVDVDITVRWSLAPSNVVDLFRRFPALDWKERAIIPIIRETIRNLIVDFTAIETIERRGVISARMEEALAEAFDREASLAGAVVLEAVNLRRIALPENFVNAIESKLAAEQLSIAAEFNKTRILVLANATAQSQIIRAEGAAKAKIIIANATREAIDAIAAQQPGLNATQLTNLYLYLETLRNIAESGGGTFIIVTGDTGQFLIPLPPSRR